MLTKRNLLIVVAVLLCIVLLAGCKLDLSNVGELLEEIQQSDVSSESETESESENNYIEDQPSESDEPVVPTEATEPFELALLRQQIRTNNCNVGIAMVDYIGTELSEEDISTYLSFNEIIEEYPFLTETDIFAYDGYELFVLVPANTDSVITLYPVDVDENGELVIHQEQAIYTGEPGAPLILRCNISENYSNVYVSVSSGDTTCEFQPIISLSDNWAIELYEGCYDFSLDDIRKYLDQAYYDLPNNFPEIQEAIDNGSVLAFADYFEFCNQTMLRFEVGKYNESSDGFIVENQYAVSFDATYSFDSEKGRWYVLGAGLKG